MKMRMAVVLGAMCLAMVNYASAEVLHGVEPLSTLGKIKKDFPNAKFERVNAAWVKESEAFFSMTGSGFPGKLYLAFNDFRTIWAHWLNSRPSDSSQSSSASEAEEDADTRAYAIAQVRQSDDDALTINWVRWVPASPIPMSRVKAKYGEPTKCDFEPEDFTPYCSWDSRSLRAQTTDDRKSVLFFTANFTRAELRSAYRARGYQMPEWLKDDAPAPAKQVSPSPRKIKPKT